MVVVGVCILPEDFGLASGEGRELFAKGSWDGAKCVGSKENVGLDWGVLWSRFSMSSSNFQAFSTKKLNKFKLVPRKKESTEKGKKEN